MKLALKQTTSQVIRQIHILFSRLFGRVSSVYFQALTMEKLSYKDYINQIRTRDNGNVQSHDQKDGTLNSTINANSGAHTLTHKQTIKNVHSIRII